MDDDQSTYPTNIKMYEKLRIIGKGAFGYVIHTKQGLGSKDNN
jgi:hypothetical protein